MYITLWDCLVQDLETVRCSCRAMAAGKLLCLCSRSFSIHFILLSLHHRFSKNLHHELPNLIMDRYYVSHFLYMMRSPRSVSFILTDSVRRLLAAQCLCVSKLLAFQVTEHFQGFKYCAWTLMGYHMLILDTFGLAQQEADGWQFFRSSNKAT